MSLEQLTKPQAREVLHELVSTGTPPRHQTPSLTVGYQDLLSVIDNDLLGDILPAGFGSVRMVVGRNGNGKTHLCRDILERAHRRNYALAEVELSEERNLSSPEELYRIVASQVTFGKEQDRTTGLDRILREHGSADDIQNHDRIGNTFREIAYSLSEDAGAMNMQERAAQWLRGEDVPSDIRRKLNLKSRLSDRNAMRWLRNLVFLCRACGAKGLVVVLDEEEATDDESRSGLQNKLSILLDILNSLTSGDLPHVLIVFSGITGSFDTQLDRLKPVRQRLYPELPFRKRMENPRTIRINTDGTGGLDERDWLERVGKKMKTLGDKAGRDIDRDVEKGIEKQINETLNSPMSLNKRTFIREVAQLVDER